MVRRRAECSERSDVDSTETTPGLPVPNTPADEREQHGGTASAATESRSTGEGEAGEMSGSPPETDMSDGTASDTGGAHTGEGAPRPRRRRRRRRRPPQIAASAAATASGDVEAGGLEI